MSTRFADPALGATHLHGVPAHYESMAAHADFAAADLSRIVGAFVGAAAVLSHFSKRGGARA